MTYTAPIWQRGVTLMELMIVVAIIAMISAFAYPSYQEYVVNTKRTAATTTLLQIADRQQQFFMDNKSYANDLTNLGYSANPLWVADDGRIVVAGDLDAVYIMTPDHLHATIALAAMKEGKHVITHKPLGNVLREARLVAEAGLDGTHK